MHLCSQHSINAHIIVNVDITLPITVIETARLNLSLLAPDDWQLMQHYQLKNQTFLAPWEPQRDELYFTEAEVKQRLRNALLSFKQQRAFHFALMDKDNACVWGVCNYSNVVRGAFQACHLGYALDEHQQGKGYMQEAIEAGNNYLFETLKFHRIMANYLPENKRSEKVLKSLGFEREGFAKQYLQIAGKWRDHVLTAKINPAQSDKLW